MTGWPEYSADFVRQRYNRLAPIYPVFEVLFALPWGIRARAAARLELQPGNRVLEVACGTGRNLPHLRNAVGSTGHVYGVDASPGMLERARERSRRNGWPNVTLQLNDACDYSLPEAVDGALFSLCYCVLSRRRQALWHAWDCLRPGGILVLMEAKSASGWRGRLLTPLADWLSRATVLGNPYLEPWKDVAELAGKFEMEEIWGGTYFICWARKPKNEAA